MSGIQGSLHIRPKCGFLYPKKTAKSSWGKKWGRREMEEKEKKGGSAGARAGWPQGPTQVRHLVREVCGSAEEGWRFYL